MDKHNIDKSFIITLIVIISLSVILISAIAILINHSNQYTEHEYKLSEISDGIYGTYNNVVSSIPAQNYDIITLCCNGSIRTFKGRVYITYTNNDPYVHYKNVNCVNADVLHVYVPFGSIVYQGTTGIGSRR